MKIWDYVEEYVLYAKEFILQFLHINVIMNELNILRSQIIELENRNTNVVSGEINYLYPPVDDLLDYRWETFKFVNVIPEGKTTSQIQINLKHQGFKTNFSEINGANHKMLLKVVDKDKTTPWMDACNATSPNAMFPVDSTRCIFGIFSNTEHRVCYISSDTTHKAIFYIRLGIPREDNNMVCQNITLVPVHKFKSNKI